MRTDITLLRTANYRQGSRARSMLASCFARGHDFRVYIPIPSWSRVNIPRLQRTCAGR